MKLMTKKLEEYFKKTGSQEDVDDPLVIAKFFNPIGSGTWLATEYEPETRMFFGYTNITTGEWGSFSLEELEGMKIRAGLGIERDRYWTPKEFSKIKQYDKKKHEG